MPPCHAPPCRLMLHTTLSRAHACRLMRVTQPSSSELRDEGLCLYTMGRYQEAAELLTEYSRVSQCCSWYTWLTFCVHPSVCKPLFSSLCVQAFVCNRLCSTAVCNPLCSTPRVQPPVFKVCFTDCQCGLANGQRTSCQLPGLACPTAPLCRTFVSPSATECCRV